MSMNRFLSRTALLSLAVTSALAGCSSVEPGAKKSARLQQAPQAHTEATEVKAPPSFDTSPDGTTAAAETSMASTIALTKTGRLQLAIPDTESVATVQTAAMSLPEMAPQVAYATTHPVSASRAAAATHSAAGPASDAATAALRSLRTMSSRAWCSRIDFRYWIGVVPVTVLKCSWKIGTLMAASSASCSTVSGSR
mgnify:CR=1 FL=1